MGRTTAPALFTALLLLSSAALAEGASVKNGVYRNTRYGFALPIPANATACWKGATTHDLDLVIGSKNCSGRNGHIVVFASWALVDRYTSAKLAEIYCKDGRYAASAVRVGEDLALKCIEHEASDAVRYVALKRPSFGSHIMPISISIIARSGDGNAKITEKYLDMVFSGLRLIDGDG